MKNSDVLEMFYRGLKGKNYSKSLVSDGKELFSYGIMIAKHYGRLTLVNGTKYSTTTSSHQGAVKRMGYCVIIPEDLFKFLVSDLDYYEAYDIIQDMFDLVGEDSTCLDIANLRKKDKELMDKVNSIFYKALK